MNTSQGAQGWGDRIGALVWFKFPWWVLGMSSPHHLHWSGQSEFNGSNTISGEKMNCPGGICPRYSTFLK